MAPYLILMTPEAPQRVYVLREGLRITQDRAQIEDLSRQVQEVTGEAVVLAYGDQGDTGEQPAEDAAAHGMQREVIRLPEARRGFVLLPRRWVVERTFVWAARFRRLARDDGRLPDTLTGLHFLAFAMWMLPRFIHLMAHL